MNAFNLNTKMADIIFTGVGEAFEPAQGNSSVLLRSTETTVLIDCGYAVPRGLFAMDLDPDLVDVIFLTHFHADHWFGLPPVLRRWVQEKRKKELWVAGQTGIEEKVKMLLELGYPGMLAKSTFSIQFIEIEQPWKFRELTLSTAPTKHSIRNLAVRIDGPGFTLGVSGDGELTQASRDLFSNCTTLVHEAFFADKQADVPAHTCAKEVIEFCATLPAIRQLALVHLHRKQRATGLQRFTELAQSVSFPVIVPSTGQLLKL